MATGGGGGEPSRPGLAGPEVAAVSLALLAPVMAVSLNPQATAGLVGRAVPLAFALATVAVLLVAWCFAALTRRFVHAGSLYAFVGTVLGARPGLVAGHAITGAYALFACTTATATGLLGAEVLRATGLAPAGPLPAGAGSAVAVGALGLAGLLALAPVRRVARLLLVVQAATVGPVLALGAVVVVRLATGTAPDGLRIDPSVLSAGEGVTLSALALGAVFGFLSFAGFEAAAALGEEAARPTRDVPVAIVAIAVLGGVFLVGMTTIEAMGFGTGPAGVAAFVASESLLGDLGVRYVGPWAGILATLAAMVSAFACCLAALLVASRILLAFARDHADLPLLAPVGRVSPARGAPAAAVGVIVAVAAGFLVVASILTGGDASSVVTGAGAIGTLVLLVAYVLAALAAWRLAVREGGGRLTAASVVPVLALGALAAVLVANTWPVPEPGTPAFVEGLAASGWLVLGVGIAIVLGRPGAPTGRGEAPGPRGDGPAYPRSSSSST